MAHRGGGGAAGLFQRDGAALGESDIPVGPDGGRWVRVVDRAHAGVGCGRWSRFMDEGEFLDGIVAFDNREIRNVDLRPLAGPSLPLPRCRPERSRGRGGRFAWYVIRVQVMTGVIALGRRLR
jgi:hypothetical protein